MMQKVETFEHDIVDEIKRKDASLTEISAASNNVGNDPVILPKKKPVFLIVLAILFVLFVAGLGVVGYIYYTDPLLNPETQRKQITADDVPKIPQDLKKLAPTIANNIGQYVSKVEKKEKGYILTITNYSAVFAYFTRNEKEYIGELANLFSVEEEPIEHANETIPVLLADVPSENPTTTQSTTTTKSTTTKQVVKKTKSTPTVATTSKSTTTKQLVTTNTVLATTSLATSSKKETTKESTSTQATSTLVSSTTTVKEVISRIAKFTDITLSNQNIRLWTSGKRSVAYAFIGDDTVIITDSPESVLTIKGGLLKK